MTRFLTPAQVMERLQLGRTVVYRLLETGELRAYKPAGRWRIAEDDLERFLESTRPDTRTPRYTPGPRRTHRAGRTRELLQRVREVSEAA